MTTINDINHTVYETSDVIGPYKTIRLQPAETIIFYKYKTDIDNKSVLDIGCGAGRTSHYLSKFTNNYIGLDYSSQMIAYCQSHYPDTRFIHGDVRDMKQIDSNSIDFVIFSFNGIDCLMHDDRLKALNEIYRVLKSDGLFVFSSHNLDSFSTYPKPKFVFSLNPVRLLRNILTWIRGFINFRKNIEYQIHHDDYEMIIDSGENFRTLFYYTSADKQIQQLAKAGFTALELLDINGEQISLPEKSSLGPATLSAWINYVARKNT